MSELQKNSKEIKQSMIDEMGRIYCQNCHSFNCTFYSVHHIVFRSEKPNHPKLHDKINLIHVCEICHNEFHRIKSSRNKLIEQRGLVEIFGNDILFTKA